MPPPMPPPMLPPTLAAGMEGDRETAGAVEKAEEDSRLNLPKKSDAASNGCAGDGVGAVGPCAGRAGGPGRFFFAGTPRRQQR